MHTNYVLIDHENVQPELLPALAQEHFKVIVFVGASQTKVSFSTAEALQRMGERAEYVKIAGNGSNALDFHIAFYIGQLAAKDPGAYFHVVSKDTGFDPLIQHLKDKKILAARTRDVAEIPALKANAKPAGDRLAAIVAKLKQLGATKPRTVKTLSSTISAHFQKQLSTEDVAALVAQLQADSLVTVAGSKVSYALPV
jgi:PIN domain